MVWEQTKLRWWHHVAIFLAAFALLITRRPEAVLHAQFYAEDGRVWFAQAYNLGGWHALFLAFEGYFMTLSRLGAALSLLAPLSAAPLVFNLIAISAQALPVNLLLSSRSSVWGSLRFRACLALVYLALPNCSEISFGLTEAPWLLALAAFLLIVATPPKSWPGRIFDIVLLLLSGLSGPFCIFLLPLAAFLAFKRRDQWRCAPVCVLAFSTLVQAFGLLILDPHSRPRAPLGATPDLLSRILGGHIFLGTLLGSNLLVALPGPRVSGLLFSAALIGMAIVAIAFARSKIEMRMFLIFSFMLLAASLVSPVAYPPPGVTSWQVLLGGLGVRYWFFPSLAFAWSLLWCAQSRNLALRAVSAVFLCVLCFGIARDWRHPVFRDLHFAEYARTLSSAPPGATVTIPINPDGWNMHLVRRASF